MSSANETVAEIVEKMRATGRFHDGVFCNIADLIEAAHNREIAAKDRIIAAKDAEIAELKARIRWYDGIIEKWRKALEGAK